MAQKSCPQKTLIVGTALVLVTSCSLCGDTPTMAHLEDVAPEVTIARGQKEPFAAGNQSKVTAGDTITTDDNGTATLRFAGGGSIFLGPNSSIYLERGPDGLLAHQVRLLFGSLEAEGKKDSLLVLTKLGKIEFSEKQSKATISAGEQGVVVKTLIGQVRMGETAIGAGISMRLDSSGIVFDSAADAGATEDAGSTSLGETPAIVITLKSGRLHRQIGGKGRFKPVTKGTQLARGDRLEAKGGTATLSLGSIGAAQMEKKARLLLSDKDSQVVPLVVERGQSRLRLNGNGSQVVEIGGLTAQVKASNRGSDVELTSKGRKSKILVREGQATVTKTDGSKIEVLGNEEALIQRGKVKINSRSSSSLRVSSSVRRVQMAGRLPAMTFTWSKLEGGGPYTIEIAKDKAFTKRLLETQVRGTAYTTDALSYGSYYWRVKNAGRTRPAHSLSIRRDRDTGDTGTRKNKVRASGERTVILYQQWQPPQLTFSWPARKDASQYQMNVYADGAFTNPLAEKRTAEAKVKLPSGKLKDGKYVWAVSSLGPNGKVLSTSDMYDLEIKYDSNKMALRVLEPRTNARVGRSTQTRGMVAPGTKLSINGETAKADNKGRFKTMAAVTNNPPLLIYKIGSTLFVRRLRR